MNAWLSGMAAVALVAPCLALGQLDRLGDGEAAGVGMSAKAAAAAPQGRPRVLLGVDDTPWSFQLVAGLGDRPKADKWQDVPPEGALHRLAVWVKPGFTGVWYRCRFAVPAEWQNRRVVLHADYPHLGAAVEVNGTPAGTLPGYGREVDVTAHLRFGETNVLHAFFSRGGAALPNRDRVTTTYGELDVRSGNAFLGFLEYQSEPYLESRPPRLEIEDVWYRTYTRGYRRVDPLVTIRACGPMRDLQARVWIVEAATGDTVRDETFAIASIAAGVTEVSLPVDATGLRLWGLREPALHVGQIVLSSADGSELDRSNPVRFGLREFWVQGRRFYLNNAPVHFVQDGLYLKWRTHGEAAAAGVTLFHSANYAVPTDSIKNPLSLVNFCDTNGLACAVPGVIAASLFASPTPDLKDPEVLRDYRLWVRHHQRRIRNHPSVLFYGLAACQGGNSGDFAPGRIGFSKHQIWNLFDLNTSHVIQREMDPTRPYYVHGGPLVGDFSTGLIYFNHIPHQEVEDWLELWEAQGDRPIMANEYSGTRLYVDFARGRMSFCTEYDARLRGDMAYAEETDEYVDYTVTGWLGAKDFGNIWNYNPFAHSRGAVLQTREGHKRTYRAWRFRGVPCFGWQFNPDLAPQKPMQVEGCREIFEQHLAVMKPTLAWIGGPADDWTDKGHNFFGGDTVTRSVLAIRDLPGMAEWAVTWRALRQGAQEAIAQGRFTERVGAFAREKWPFSFVVPGVDRPTRINVEVAVTDADTGEAIGADAFALTAYPSRVREGAPLPLVEKARWAVIDPEGETDAWLRDLGLYVPPHAGSNRGIDVLILGRRALRHLRQPPFSAEEVAAGLRVLIMEQHSSDLQAYGFRVTDHCPRNVFVRQPGHPLNQGLVADSLRFWQGAATLVSQGPMRDNKAAETRHFHHWSNRGNVASVVIETPHLGPFSPFMDCEFDLTFSPLMTWRHGKGEVVFCQLDLTGRVNREPGATRVARNLVDYLAAPEVLPPQERTAVCVGERALATVGALGFDARPWSGSADRRHDVLVLDGRDAESVAQDPAAVMKFVRKGGTALVLEATAPFLAGPAFAGRVEVREQELTRAGRGVDVHPLLAGVGPQDVHWRQPAAMWVLSSSDPAFKPLLGGLMGVLREGRGQFVFLQIAPAAFADMGLVRSMVEEAQEGKKDPVVWSDRIENNRFRRNVKRSAAHAQRLQSTVLGNLGVLSRTDLVSRLLTPGRSASYVPVNDWMYLGLFVPPEEGDCLDKDLSRYLDERDPDARYANSNGETVQWYRPTDYNNGLGIDGRMDFVKAYPRRLKHLVIAVTQVWSSCPREATIRFGADWWHRIAVNGQEVFRTASGKGEFAIDFNNSVRIPLKAGWNDVACVVGAGSNSHVLWFKISDPGDVRVCQSVVTPDWQPDALPAVEDLLPEDAPPGFSLYGEIFEDQDPYSFSGW